MTHDLAAAVTGATQAMAHIKTPRPANWLTLGLISCAALTSINAMAASSGGNKPPGCLIEPEQVADVGSPVTGVIEELPIALGDAVDAGQALVRLRADVERANAGVAMLRAQVDAEVKAAQANWDLARQKVRRSQQLLDQNFVSAQAVEQATAEAEVAAQKLKLAQSQQKIYAREETVAQAQLGLRTLRSPIKGVVIERYNNIGERVEDKPVVRIASIDPLRVSLMVPVAQYGQVAVGSALVIKPELPGADAVRATVTYIDKVVDAASNSFRVRLSLPNPGNRLPGGLRCKAEWNTAQAPAAPAPANMAPKPSAAVKPQQPPVIAAAVKPAQPPVVVAAIKPLPAPAMNAAATMPSTPQAAPVVTAKVRAELLRATNWPTLQLKTSLTLSYDSLSLIAWRTAVIRTAALEARDRQRQTVPQAAVAAAQPPHAADAGRAPSPLLTVASAR